LDSFDGKMVTVRGVFEKKTHGAFLVAENCGVRGKYVLPGTTPSMLLAMPDEAIDQDARRPHFRMDPKSILELDRLADLSNRGKPVPKIVVNGEISVFKKFSAKRQPDGGYIGHAFGPYGRYPAILVIKTLREEQGPRPGSR